MVRASWMIMLERDNFVAATCYSTDKTKRAAITRVTQMALSGTRCVVVQYLPLSTRRTDAINYTIHARYPEGAICWLDRTYGKWSGLVVDRTTPVTED
jgi:hypothetical protein